MGMTITQKILAYHANLENINAGDLIISKVDLALTNDIMGEKTFEVFKKIG